MSVQAQSLTKPGVEVSGNINARGTVTGAITQIGGGALSFANGGIGGQSAGSIGIGGQNARVGGVAGTVRANQINANGTVTGTITQLRVGALEGANEQLVSVGSVSNTEGNNINVTGNVAGIVSQIGGSLASGLNAQVLQVGGVDEVRANNINARGSLNGVSSQVTVEGVGGCQPANRHDRRCPPGRRQQPEPRWAP